MANTITITPEFFPIPQRGVDPHFGLGRSSYYDLEKRGLVRLVRIKKPGNQRGKVLVPFAAMGEVMKRFASESAA